MPAKKGTTTAGVSSPEVKRLISYVQLAQDQAQVGCHVQNFVDKWKQVTSDPWVLKIVEEGLRLKCVSKPPKSGVRTTNLLNIVHMSNILEEVNTLLGKGAIELVPPGQEGQVFYSTFFIVPKKDGGLRPILNLKPLNVYMEKSHFKMETLRSIIQALHVGDWGSTFDLRDAYLQIPMFPPHRKYLRFCVQGVHYQFRAMPFGITVAPRVFTKLMAAVGGHLRSQQIHIFMYLDDWLDQKSDSKIVTSSIKSNNTSSGRSRIDNPFRQMPFSAFTDNYLSGCSFQPEQMVSSPLREQVFGNQPSNCRYNLQPPMSSFPFFTTVGTHGFVHRYSSIWPFTYAPYPNIPSLFLAPTYRWTTFQNSSFPHTSNTLNVVATREEYFQRGTPAGISTQQSSVDRCIQVGLGCTLEHSSGGRSVAEGIDQSSYQLARDESCMECLDIVSGGDSGRESCLSDATMPQ